MNTLKTLSFLSLLLIFSLPVFAAKPTDEQVLKDITHPNMKNIKLSKSGGTYSVYRLQRWWTRGVTYTTSARIKEFPKAQMTIGAEARYRIIGENYDFDKLKLVWSEYSGIPMPSDEEILELINNDIVTFVQPYNWNRMVSELDGPILSKDPAIRNLVWHTANSFTITLQAKFSVISSNTEVQDIETDFEVRFYRDSVTQPWKKRFLSSKRNEKIVATHKYKPEEIEAMSTQASKAAEKKAQAAAAQLPSIQIPIFKTDKEAFVFIYKILKTGNRTQLEAMMRAMMSSFYYVKGSKLRLNSQGEEFLKKVMTGTFDRKISFADSYCPQIFIKKYQPNMIQISDALKKNHSRISLSLEGGGYNRGKKVGQTYKISALEVWTLRTDDAIAQFKSWPFAELCDENAKTMKQLSTAKITVEKQPQKAVMTQNSALASSTKRTTTATSNTKQPNMNTATAIIAAAPKKKIDWLVFNSKYLPVSMQIIGQPIEKQKMKNGRKLTAMVAKSVQGVFRLSATDFRQNITPQIATPTHVKFAKSFVKNNNALIHNKKQVDFGSGKALDYLVERGSGANRVMIKYRVFSSGTIVYQAYYTQFKKRFDKTLAQKFIDSITIKK